MKYLIFVLVICSTYSAHTINQNLIDKLRHQKNDINELESSIFDLINRIVGGYQSPNDFVVKIDNKLHPNHLDTFELEMIQNNKLQITGNSPVAAAWGFNYYLKYYTNSSIFWSGKNINLNGGDLPRVPNKIRITSSDYIRFNQNICTHSYSYVWWNWDRWEYEIDWMVLNGINMVYAQTAAEYPWINVLSNLGLTREEIDNFFTGPAYLAWFRMGNLKKFGGPLPQSWHEDQLELQLRILKRYDELGIKYVLPGFAGFVPDQIMRLFPEHNFTKASSWDGFNCNFSCLLIVDPLDPLFQQIGKAYNSEVIKLFGSSGFYSADVFNEMPPKSLDLEYLAEINHAIYESLSGVDTNATWVMQGWLFNDGYWDKQKVQAFLSRVPIGRLIILDLYAEFYPHYYQYSSYFGHYFIWNMLHNFGGANGLFGDLRKINKPVDDARTSPNSSMIGIGITMEGINQNEIMYEFMLEKTWRSFLDETEFTEWIFNYTSRRYSNSKTSQIDLGMLSIMRRLVNTFYEANYFQLKQLFTKRPSLNLSPENFPNTEQLYSVWDDLVKKADNFKNSPLFRYDLVDFSKEVLRYIFDDKYYQLVKSFNDNDLFQFSQLSSELIEVLQEMEELLASNENFLLSKWIDAAKSKGINYNERVLYEFNARSQLTLWGLNTTYDVFDYACKAWSGLIQDYYMPRWTILFDQAKWALVRGSPLDLDTLIESLLVNAELPFVFSNKQYPLEPKGDTISIVKNIHSKYRL